MSLVEEADQLHDENVHSLELEIVAGEKDMSKATLVEEVDAVQLHDVNVHWLK